MTKFATILKPSCAVVGLDAADKASALAAITDVLAAGVDAVNAQALLPKVLAREELASTGIGEGIAIPHAVSSSIPDTVMAIARLAKPVEFAAVDGQPVDVVILLVGPEGSSGVHLQILSKLARLLHDPSFRDAVRSAPDGAALAGLLYARD
jgi:mannitol/fructose-specific phosphotransferase system IIA component (Ntr-type)